MERLWCPQINKCDFWIQVFQKYYGHPMSLVKCHTFMFHNMFIFFRRSNTSTNDLWFTLEQNWDHFFWLTGDIPPSLNLIVNEIRPKLQIRGRGRKLSLSVRNQVCLFVCVKRNQVKSDICVYAGTNNFKMSHLCVCTWWKNFCRFC